MGVEAPHSLDEYRRLMEEKNQIMLSIWSLTSRCLLCFQNHPRSGFAPVDSVQVMLWSGDDVHGLIAEWLNRIQVEANPATFCRITCYLNNDGYETAQAIVPRSFALPQNDFEQEELETYLKHMGDKVWL